MSRNLEKYLGNNEVVFDKKAMNGKYRVGSSRIVAFTHDTPFMNKSISVFSQTVNILKISIKKIMVEDAIKSAVTTTNNSIHNSEQIVKENFLKNRSTKSSESTSPINADYRERASKNGILNSPQNVKKFRKVFRQE